MTRPGLDHRPPARARRAVRRLLRLLVGCGVLALLVDTWLVEGLLTPVIVASGSMAPALVGPHRQWQCAGCGYPFVCGLESLPAPGAAAVCPNCGFENDADHGVDREGQRVLIDRSAFLWRAPRRWEAVVFGCPDDAHTLCVKRVVGLPGESVQIVDGDVLIDGQIAQKGLAAAQAMEVPVYTAPRADQRWQPSPAETWQSTDGRFTHPGRAENGPAVDPSFQADEPIDWLVYHHRQRAAGRTVPGPIRDESPYDQNESRALTAVRDVALRAEIRAEGAGAVLLHADSQGERFEARIDVATGAGELLPNGQAAAPIAAAARPFGRFAKLEFMLADHRVQLALNDRLLVEYDFRRPSDATRQSDQPETAAHQPLAIGAQGATVEIRNLQITRDVYYTSGERPGSRTCQLGPDEYFLLGDNSAHALDSRSWSPAGLSGTRLIGKVLK